MQTETNMNGTNGSGERASRPGDNRALKILAKSVYRELKAGGHSRSEIVGFTNALLELVTSDIEAQRDSTPGDPEA